MWLVIIIIADTSLRIHIPSRSCFNSSSSHGLPPPIGIRWIFRVRISMHDELIFFHALHVVYWQSPAKNISKITYISLFDAMIKNKKKDLISYECTKVPRQSSLLHFLVSNSFSGHCRPLFETWISTVRNRFCLPSPQVLLHSPQDSQFESPQFTFS